jgi:hypothetical protein
MSPLLMVVMGIALVFGMVVFFGAPYVPSRSKYIRRVLVHYGLGKGDVLVDLGSGDGIVLRTASRLGIKSVGYEINPILVLITRLLSLHDKNVRVVLQNAWRARLPDDITIVYAFAVSRDEKKLTRLMQRESNRLQRPLQLLCYASPFRHTPAASTFEAYHLYIFQPLQQKTLKV